MVNVRIDGGPQLLKAIQALGPDANKAIRDKANQLATDLAGKAKSAASSDEAPQSHLLAPTIRAKRDRVPAITMGGSRSVGSRHTPAFEVMFGAEFGSNLHPQFHRPHAGRAGYFFFPLVETEAATISRAWLAAADEVVREFGRGI
jgi:hypothetical protein